MIFTVKRPAKRERAKCFDVYSKERILWKSGPFTTGTNPKTKYMFVLLPIEKSRENGNFLQVLNEKWSHYPKRPTWRRKTNELREFISSSQLPAFSRVRTKCTSRLLLQTTDSNKCSDDQAPVPMANCVFHSSIQPGTSFLITNSGN